MAEELVLTDEESEKVSRLKKEGGLLRVTAEQLQGMTRHGGSFYVCSDNKIDALSHHIQIVNSNPIMHFGMPYLLVPEYRGYKKEYADATLGYSAEGMNLKSTQAIFLCFHYPCGHAKVLHGHSLEEALQMAAKLTIMLKADKRFNPQKIHPLFHVKRINKGGKLEQNTYLMVI